MKAPAYTPCRVVMLLPGGRRRMAAAIILSLSLSLGACATAYTPMNGASTDETKRSSDLSTCRDSAILDDEGKSAAGGFLIGALYGAAEGAAIGAIHGGSAEGAIIGAAAGALVGFAVGMASGDRSLDQCMAGRGGKKS